MTSRVEPGESPLPPHLPRSPSPSPPLSLILTWLSRPVPAGHPMILLRLPMSWMGVTGTFSWPASRTSVPLRPSPGGDKGEGGGGMVTQRVGIN